MSEHAGESHYAKGSPIIQILSSGRCHQYGGHSVCLPDTGEFLEENGDLFQTWKIQMWVSKEPGGRLEKVLTAARVNKFIQVA